MAFVYHWASAPDGPDGPVPNTYAGSVDFNLDTLIFINVFEHVFSAFSSDKERSKNGRGRERCK
jgi:hypothetical protein